MVERTFVRLSSAVEAYGVVASTCGVVGVPCPDREDARTDRPASAQTRASSRRRPASAPIGGNMASLDDLYAVSRRLCFDISDGLTRLERDEARGVARNEALGREMRARIGELKRITSEMERQWRSMAMTASISKSDMWKVRRSMRRGALEGMNSTDASVVASWCPRRR
tara:strand:+ start:802 stop:1308 length:507 start_codon:yes stop_codon:yes gene_type:complete